MLLKKIFYALTFIWSHIHLVVSASGDVKFWKMSDQVNLENGNQSYNGLDESFSTTVESNNTRNSGWKSEKNVQVLPPYGAQPDKGVSAMSDSSGMLVALLQSFEEDLSEDREAELDRIVTKQNVVSSVDSFAGLLGEATITSQATVRPNDQRLRRDAKVTRISNKTAPLGSWLRLPSHSCSDDNIWNLICQDKPSKRICAGLNCIQVDYYKMEKNHSCSLLIHVTEETLGRYCNTDFNNGTASDCFNVQTESGRNAGPLDEKGQSVMNIAGLKNTSTEFNGTITFDGESGRNAGPLDEKGQSGMNIAGLKNTSTEFNGTITFDGGTDTWKYITGIGVPLAIGLTIIVVLVVRRRNIQGWLLARRQKQPPIAPNFRGNRSENNKEVVPLQSIDLQPV